ncbi:MAG: hypothetical protein ACRD2B_11995 [Terriglobia bacterium]
MNSQTLRRKCTLTLLMFALSLVAVQAIAMPRRHPPLTTLYVLVTDAKTSQPIFQAHLTLQFPNPDSRTGKLISYSAKTDIRGKYKFSFIPMGEVFLVVTAQDHQSLGRRFQITQENQTIAVKLRKPQPLR